MEERETVIIGGGACALMCAVQAGYLGKEVLILEKNSRAGAKILISGGGRCNYTNLNSSVENFISQNQQFARSAFSQWTVDDTIGFFESFGILPQEKTLGQLFPISNKANDILIAFENACKDLGQELRCLADVDAIEQVDSGRFEINYLHKGKEKKILCKNVVIASGGLPIKKMGASDFALRIARKFKIEITETAPALVPLVITGKDAAWFESLSGNTVFSKVSIGKVIFEENILFTHWGLSGPAILQISSYWKPGISIEIDLLPGRNILEILKKARAENGKKILLTLISGIYTRRFAESLKNILPIEKNLGDLNLEEMNKIASWIHHFNFKPAGDKGYEKAEVMRGGISTNELNSKTMESRKVPGMYFGGECVDITGWLGGYNFQWAWASGFVIAQNL